MKMMMLFAYKYAYIQSVIYHTKNSNYLQFMLWQNDDFHQIGKAVKVIERMVNQNTFDDVSQGINWVAKTTNLCYLQSFCLFWFTSELVGLLVLICLESGSFIISYAL